MKSLFDLKEVISAIRDHMVAVPTIPVDEVYEVFIELFDTLLFVRKGSTFLAQKNKIVKPDPEPFTPTKFNVGGLVNIVPKPNFYPLGGGEKWFLEQILMDLIQARDLIKEEILISKGKEITKKSREVPWYHTEIEILAGFNRENYDYSFRQGRDRFLKDMRNRIQSTLDPPKKRKSKKRRRKAKYFAKEAQYRQSKK